MKRFLPLILIFISAQTFAQRLNLGMFYEFPFSFFHVSHIGKDKLFSPYSYRVYNIHKKTQVSSLGTCLGMGPYVGVDYGKYKCSSGLLLSMGTYKFSVDYPVGPETWYSYIAEIKYQKVDIPLVFGYSFFNNRSIRLYAEVGPVYSMPYFYTESAHLKSDLSENGAPVFKGILWDKKNHWEALASIGIYGTGGAASIKYQRSFLQLNEPKAYTGYFVLSIQVFNNFDKLRKHYLYIQ